MKPDQGPVMKGGKFQHIGTEPSSLGNCCASHATIIVFLLLVCVADAHYRFL